MRIIAGDFLEKHKVTVLIDGVEVTRTVRYRTDCGLYIVYKNRMYFEYEVDYGKENLLHS